jgi:hypothetical protein
MRLHHWILPKIAAVMAVLAVPAQLPQTAQDHPQPKQDPSPFTLATAKYNFLIASGFLCDPNHSGDCPAVAQAANGESIEISGAGTLSLAENSVTAAGTFTEKSSKGDTVTTGVWTATALASLQSYGLAPGALLRDYPQLRTFGAFTKGGSKVPTPIMASPMVNLMAGPLAAGGLAVIRIRMLPDAGSPRDALLRINCALGKVPEDASSDSVRVTIRDGLAYDSPVSGKAVFLVRRPVHELASKDPAAADPER